MERTGFRHVPAAGTLLEWSEFELIAEVFQPAGLIDTDLAGVVAVADSDDAVFLSLAIDCEYV